MTSGEVVEAMHVCMSTFIFKVFLVVGWGGGGGGRGGGMVVSL